MSRPEMGDVLLAILEAIGDGGSVADPISGASLLIEEADIDLPLEGYVVLEQGKPVLRTGPPLAFMRTGIMAPVHRGRLHLVLLHGTEGAG